MQGRGGGIDMIMYVMYHVHYHEHLKPFTSSCTPHAVYIFMHITHQIAYHLHHYVTTCVHVSYCSACKPFILCGSLAAEHGEGGCPSGGGGGGCKVNLHFQHRPASC